MEKIDAKKAREISDSSDYVMNDVFGKIQDAANENIVSIGYSFLDCSEAATHKAVESLKCMGYTVVAPIAGREGEPFASDYIISW
jgi:phage tail tape-measure protein